MNITYIIGLGVCIVVMVFGMMFSTNEAGQFAINVGQIANFFDPSSILITIGCTFATVVASFPLKQVTSMPKHFKILYV